MIKAFPIALLTLLSVSGSVLLAHPECFGNLEQRTIEMRQILWYTRYVSLDQVVWIQNPSHIYKNATETRALIQSLLADGSYYMTINKEYCRAINPIIQLQLNMTFEYVCKNDTIGFNAQYGAFLINLKDWLEFCIQSKPRSPSSITRPAKVPLNGSVICIRKINDILGNLTHIFDQRENRTSVAREYENLKSAQKLGCFISNKPCDVLNSGLNLVLQCCSESHQ
eukprot:TRINITY_DN112_c0_g1_i5.p1 TRINITY_DN112_c0_g1~~TRINITY_DN112_c0_g1_i5.p1  ORF type:complete len:225 (-),score=56.90 TRINITY_DN112_c0_g1_i5:269-943(-)